MALEGLDNLIKYYKEYPNSDFLKLKELDIEIDRLTGRIFVKEGSNLMHYIKDGKVWVTKCH